MSAFTDESASDRMKREVTDFDHSLASTCEVLARDRRIFVGCLMRNRETVSFTYV
jgi:hypothetical protein